MERFFYLVVFLAIIVFGVGLETIFSKIYFRDRNGKLNKHQVVHFKLSRYLFLLLVPILDILFFTYLIGASVLVYFFVFAILGTILEYCIGYSYHTIVGKNLWTYNQYSFNGHTSLLAVPLWGLCGTLMYLMLSNIH